MEDNAVDGDVDDVVIAVSGGRTKQHRTRWDNDQREMQEQLDRYGAGHHITEIYAPPRVTKWASKMRMAPGLALDLTCNDPDDGLPWDVNNNPNKVTKARRIIQDTKPLLLVGSPICAAVSHMSNIIFSRMSEQDVNDVVEHGTRHLELCMDLCRTHMKNGLYFLHAHPAHARRLQHTDVMKMMNRQGVRTVVGDTCAFGWPSTKTVR